jgi:DNA-binding LacI/PurR family transcriptional regulator
MATRHEVNRQKSNLQKSLREACRNGTLKIGDPVPSLRQLSTEYNLSRRVVTQSLQELVDEGLFYSVPRLGTFVGKPHSAQSECYLCLRGSLDPTDYNWATDQMVGGFEEKIAHLGGTVIVLPVERALSHKQNGELPPIMGVFDLSSGMSEKIREEFCISRNGGIQAAFVRYGNQYETDFDTVAFDDVHGGRTATEYLLRQGHRRIAFIGLHSVEHHDQWSYMFDWSREREAGWKMAMESAGQAADGLAFHPAQERDTMSHVKQAQRVYETMRRQTWPTEITAAVAANDAAALGLIQALQQQAVAPEKWPSVVGFDSAAQARQLLLTSLRLPWNQIGSTAAELLWERKTGRLTSKSEHRQVRMHLIQRLTTHPDWSRKSGQMTELEAIAV